MGLSSGILAVASEALILYVHVISHMNIFYVAISFSANPFGVEDFTLLCRHHTHTTTTPTNPKAMRAANAPRPPANALQSFCCC